jgi:hypothetical protein
VHAKRCVRVDDGLEPVKSKAAIADVREKIDGSEFGRVFS